MKTPKLISSKIAFRGKNFNVRVDRIKLPNGRIANWDSVNWNNDSVIAVAVDEKNNVYFSKEWRSAWKKEITIVPSGSVRKNAGESESIRQVRNELREEIKFDARKIEKLVTILSSSKMNSRIHIYLATDLVRSPKKADPEEVIKAVRMPIKKAYKLFLTGKMETTSYTILGIILAMNKLGVR